MEVDVVARAEAAAEAARQQNIVQDFLRSGGRIFHNRRGRSSVTVAYRYAGDGEIDYGATVHKRTSNADQWNRKDHNYTAINRCMSIPVTVADVPEMGPRERNHYLRQCVVSQGCSTEGE